MRMPQAAAAAAKVESLPARLVNSVAVAAGLVNSVAVAVQLRKLSV
jgi:hypothetical protein